RPADAVVAHAARTRLSVRLLRARARARHRVAGAGLVARVPRFAHDGRPRLADAAVTGIVLGARVAVIAVGAVARLGVRALARRRIADAGVVACIERRAPDRIGAGAYAALARVGPRAGVAVVARWPRERLAGAVDVRSRRDRARVARAR